MPDLEPLDSEVGALLAEAEPKDPKIPDALRAQMRARIQTALSVPPNAPNAPNASHAPSAAPAASPAPMFPQIGRLGAGAIGVALGIAGTLGAVRMLEPPPQVREVPVFVQPSAPPRPSEAPPPPAPSQVPTASASTPKPPAPPSATIRAAHDDALAAEGQLIDTARAALGRGDFAAALAAVDRHAEKFPQGRLREEREAIAIQALAGVGRMPAARARGEAFRKAYPSSVFLPLVSAAIGADPE